MANLIHNGSFVGNADGWVKSHADTGIDFAPGESRSEGSGALSVARAGSSSTIFYRPGGAHAVPIDGLTTFDLVAYPRSDAANPLVQLGAKFFADADALEPVGLEVLAPAGGALAVTGGWAEIAERGVAVPEGAAYVRLRAEVNATDGVPVYLDDVYLGPPGGDTPPYAAAAEPALPNDGVPNGTFEAGIVGWDGWWTSETLTHETVDPIAGTGSLRVVTPGDGEEQGVVVPAGSGNAMIVVPGESLTLGFTARGTGTIKCVVDYDGAADVVVWTGTLSGSSQAVEETVTVPEGAFRCWLLFLTTTAEVADFVLDDVAFVGPRTTSSAMANLIRNGSFVGHVSGWYPAGGGETVAYESGASATPGSGSLALNGGSWRETVFRPSGTPWVSVGAAGTIDVVAAVRCADSAAAVSIFLWCHAVGTTHVFLGTTSVTTHAPLGGTAWRELSRRNVTLPSGTTHVLVVVRAVNAANGVPVFIDDVYVGPSGGDSPPYPGEVVPGYGGVRLYNGSFETGIAGWEDYFSATLTHETSSPLLGAGSLRVTTVGEWDYEGITTLSSFLGMLWTPGESLTLSFLGRATGPIRVEYLAGGSIRGEIWTGALPSTGRQAVTVDFSAPAGEYRFAALLFNTVNAAPTTFWLDDVVVGPRIASCGPRHKPILVRGLVARRQ